MFPYKSFDGTLAHGCFSTASLQDASVPRARVMNATAVLPKRCLGAVRRLYDTVLDMKTVRCPSQIGPASVRRLRLLQSSRRNKSPIGAVQALTTMAAPVP